MPMRKSVPHALCGAKTRSGEPCKGWAMENGRCRMHGGGNPKGFAHPNTVTGRYSKHLPTRAIAEFQQALHDPELLSLRNDIALIDVRLNELVREVGTDETPDKTTWSEIRYVIQDRRALVESERRRLIDMQQMITGQDAMLLVARLVDIISRHVTDPLARRAIAGELDSLMLRANPGRPDSAD